MRTLRDILSSDRVNAGEEEIAVCKWLREFPETGMAQELAAKWPHLAERAKGKTLRPGGG